MPLLAAPKGRAELGDLKPNLNTDVKLKIELNQPNRSQDRENQNSGGFKKLGNGSPQAINSNNSVICKINDKKSKKQTDRVHSELSMNF